MEVNEDKRQESIMFNSNNKKIIAGLIIISIILIVVLVVPNRKGRIEISAKTSLDKIVEKSDLETVNFTYNVIAKKCKDSNNCNLESNNINDFEYVVSCRGKLTAGIDFDEIEINTDNSNKKLIVTIPEPVIKDANVLSFNFLNGSEIPANELPRARKLCEDTIMEKSKKDGKLLPVAKEQAAIVLESFYSQWLKIFDKDYKIEVR